ncbi:hypothetical protein BC941DRAFT_470383 [Chlamydoabsidia padenii]|nr:hypothetical protein BC941DRAFT_470383 [Chlamydoabsidia padenii]
MASFPPPPSPTPTMTTTITFLSSSQLTGIANKLASAEDQKRYRQLIALSSTIQTKLNQIRLDRMNAVTERSSFDLRHSTQSTTSDLEELPTARRTTLSIGGIDESKTTQERLESNQSSTTTHVESTLTDTLSAPDRSLPELHLLVRRDSAVDIIQQTSPPTQPQTSFDCLGQFTDKALPAFPSLKRNSNKYDSIFDTTSYYYEQQQQEWEHDDHPLPLPPPYILPKTTPFGDHLGFPSPSSVTTPTNTAFDNQGNYTHLNSSTMDPSFLLITPPESPRYIDCISAPVTQSTPLLNKEQQPLPLPPVIHCQRKINGLLGFLTRTYQINEIVSSRILISSLGLFNAMDTSTGHQKAVLKVTMTSSDIKDRQQQGDTLDMDMLARFGFTFYASVRRSPNVKRPHREDPHCLVVSDRLVSDALDYWIQHQRDGLPVLTNATHILKESAKIYVVYDRSLLLQQSQR